MITTSRKYAEVTSGEYYGYVVSILESSDRGELGMWYYTEDLPNEYTGYYQMWFKEDELNFDVEV